MTAVMTPMPAVGPTTSSLEFQLYEADNATPVLLASQPVVWTGTTDAKARCVLGDATTGTEFRFTLPFNDPRWPLLVSTPGRLVRAYVRGVLVDACVPRIEAATPIPESGSPATVTFTCISRVAAMDGGLVELRAGTESYAGALDKRMVSGWQLPEYDVSGWADPVVGNYAYNPVPPKGWFSPFTRWTTHGDAGPGDTLLFVYDFTLSAPKILVPRRSAFGGCRGWLNGVPIGETPLPPSNAKEKTYRWPLNVATPGSNRLAFEVIGAEGEPPQFLCEVYAVDDVETGECTTATFLFQTGQNPGATEGDPPVDAPWKVYRVTGSTRPGLTVGQIIGTHLTEQQADGVHTGITRHFDDDLDSALDAWPEVQNLVTDTLKTTPELFSQLAASECDLWLARDSNQLLGVGWRQRGTFHEDPTDAPKFAGGRSGLYGVDPATEGNLSGLTWERTIVPDDVTIVYRYRDGYGSVGTGPKRAFDFGDIDAQAAATLAEAMATARTDKAVTYTARVFEVDEDHQFDPEHIWLGDAISVPVGTPAVWENQRVVAVDYTVDGAGNVTTTVELSSARVEVQAHLDRRIARLHAGNQSETITAPDKFGTDIEGGEVRTEEMVFSKDGRVNEGSLISQRYPFPKDRRRLNQFTATLRETDPTYYIWAEILIDGTAVHLLELQPGELKTVPGDGWIGPHHGQWPDMAQVQFVDGADDDDGFLVDWTAEGFALVVEHCPPL